MRRFFWQNLTRETRRWRAGVSSVPWCFPRWGRAFLRYGGDWTCDASVFCFEWALFMPAPYFEVGATRSDQYGYGLHLCVPWVAQFYLSTGFGSGERRSLAVQIARDALWWCLWRDPHGLHASTDPWYVRLRHSGIRFRSLIPGRPKWLN